MATTVNQHQQSALTSPINGDALDASVVLGDINAVGTTHNAHDADSGIHIQSSTLAGRPAASTAGRTWVTSDGLRAYYDNGSAWQELDYLCLTAGGTVVGALVLSSTLTVAGILTATSGLTAGTTQLTVNGAASNVRVGTVAAAAITSTTDLFVAYMNAGHALNPGGVNGSLLLYSRNVAGAEVVLAAEGAVIVRVKAAGVAVTGTLSSSAGLSATTGAFSAGVTCTTLVPSGLSTLQAVTCTTLAMTGALTGVTTITASGAISGTVITGSTALAAGGTVATVGDVRIKNNGAGIVGRNAANAADLTLLDLGATDICTISRNADLTLGGAALKIGFYGAAGAVKSTGWTNQTAAASKADLGAAPTVGQLASWASAIDALLKANGLYGT